MKNPLTYIVLLPYFSLLFLTLQASKGVVGREEKRREEKRREENRPVNAFEVAFSRKLFPP